VPDMTYDPEADAAYIYLGAAAVVESEDVSPGVVLDYDAEGRVVGVEVLNASRTLAPGDWSRARLPGPNPAHAAE
jgi:uncharacterized protein YuzE